MKTTAHQPTSQKPVHKHTNKWYQRNAGLIFLLIIFWPLGLYFMWKYAVWNKTTRIVLSAVFLVPFLFICVVVIIAVSMPSTTPTASTQPTKPVAKVIQPAPTKKAVSKPVTTSTTTKTTPTAPVDTLTGFGATQANWDKYNNADPNISGGYNPNSQYGEGEQDDQFYLVAFDGKYRVDGYSQNIAHGTDLATAKAQILSEFPSDTTTLWEQTNTQDSTEQCYQMEVTSPTLATTLGADGDESDGDVYIEVQSANNAVFDASSVSLAQIGMLFDYKTAADATAGGC